MQRCRGLGWIPGVVERWLPYTQRRQDLFGFVDLVVIADGRVKFLQVSTGSNMGARIEKIITEHRETAMRLAQCDGADLEVWAWRQLRGKGRQRWWAKRVRLCVEDGLFFTVDLEDL